MVFLLKKTKTCTVGQRQRVCTITKKTDSMFYHGKKRQVLCAIMEKRNCR